MPGSKKVFMVNASPYEGKWLVTVDGTDINFLVVYPHQVESMARDTIAAVHFLRELNSFDMVVKYGPALDQIEE